jgi:CRP-like cAMP-binding protein
MLPALGLLNELREEDRDLLASYGEYIGAQAGRELITQGEDQRHLYFVISGRLEAVVENQVVGSIQAGESIGEIAILDPGVATGSVKASDFSQIWRIDYDSLRQFAMDNPGAANALLLGLSTLLAKRIRGLLRSTL